TMVPPSSLSSLFPYTTLFRFLYHILLLLGVITALVSLALAYEQVRRFRLTYYYAGFGLVATAGLALLSSHFISSGVAEVLNGSRSEEHTSELQSRENLVCRLL